MYNDNKRRFRSNRHDRFWTGLILVIIGGFLLADKIGFDFPWWLFTWPMILILVGIVTGIKHRFHNCSWLILIAIGGFFLADEINTDWSLRPYFWPVMIIGLGLLFILRPKKKRWGNSNKWKDRWQDFGHTEVNTDAGTSSSASYSSEDVIDSVSVFGGVKKVITSKNFKGGDIVCFMGGAEYNLLQADFTGTIVIDIVQAFGGTKLIVPPHWEIRSEGVAIFAGIEDKRPVQPGVFDPAKVLILNGITIFGGIEIKSY
jgi:hypothetical protein